MKEADGITRRAGRLDWRQVKFVYLLELRSAFREKTIVLNTLLIPIFLYPLIMWAAFTGLMFVQGQAERFPSRVAITGWPEKHPALRSKFERNKQVEIVKVQASGPAAEKIRRGEVDCLLEFLPPDPGGQSLADNFRVRMTFNASVERSETARRRVAGMIEDYRAQWLGREARRLGIDGTSWEGFVIEPRNLASGKQMGGFLLGLIIPVLFVVMVAMGCFYPAVDATAGERERNTWETLMATAATRVSIITGKYLYVVTMGGLAGMLNLTAMALTMKPIFAPLLGKAGVSMNFAVPLASLPFLALAAVLLAGFVSAGMMIFASFARTFKEGQAMIMPFYMLVLLPAMFLQVPGLKFSVLLALVPVVNVTMLVRSAVSGTFPWLPIALTLLVSLGVIAGCLRLAAFILQFEDVMLGSYSGSMKRFVKERLWGSRRPS